MRDVPEDGVEAVASLRSDNFSVPINRVEEIGDNIHGDFCICFVFIANAIGILPAVG